MFDDDNAPVSARDDLTLDTSDPGDPTDDVGARDDPRALGQPDPELDALAKRWRP